MSTLTPFTYSGQQVRTVTIDGEPWFVIADVCAVLGLTNPTMAANTLDADDLSTTEVIDSMGRTQTARTANESGLYGLIFQSRKPEAKAFKRWITHEVLPAIRKTGSYGVAAPAELSRLEILTLALESEQRALAAEATVRELEPKADAYDRVIATGDAQKIEFAARKANVGRTTAFQLLRNAGVLQRFNRSPKQPYAYRFIEEPKPFTNLRTGLEEIAWTTKVRPEHFDWLVTKLIDLKSTELANV